MLGRRSTKPVDIGDRFEKVGQSRSVWTVEDVLARPGLPPHARLSDPVTGRFMTVAESILHDPDVFRAAPANQHLPDSQ